MSEEVLYKYNLQFFADDGPGGEKTEAPTAKKLSDARKDGRVAQSKEVASSITLFAMFLLLKIWTGVLATQFLEMFSGIYGRFSQYSTLYGGEISSKEFSDLIVNILLRVLIMTLPYLAAAFVNSLMEISLYCLLVSAMRISP